ncbi:hypothetical protein GCM10009850_083380 [Nonomuraea monospora]|uniref:Uncharacterized protein n=2 Tax=Nonomuraea monospora TaxID=568818 RepID=A0ABP5PMF8_9ACTN
MFQWSSSLLVRVAGGLALVSGVVAAIRGLALVISDELRGVASVRCLPIPHTFDVRVSGATDLSAGARYIPPDTLLVADASVAEQVMAHGENLLIALCVFCAGILLYRLSRSLPHDLPSARRCRVGLAWLCATVALFGPLAPYYTSAMLLDRVGFSGACTYSYSEASMIPVVTAALLFAVGAWVRRAVPDHPDSVD